MLKRINCTNHSIIKQAIKFLSSFELMLYIFGLILIDVHHKLFKQNMCTLIAVLLVKTIKGKLQNFKENEFRPLLGKIWILWKAWYSYIGHYRKLYQLWSEKQRQRPTISPIRNIISLLVFNQVDIKIKEFGDGFNKFKH